MHIKQKEVIEANHADLLNYIPERTGEPGERRPDITETAERFITVSPADGGDWPEYDVYFTVPMMIATTHEEWDFDFLNNIAKGLTGMVGLVATGNIEGAVINGITVATGTLKKVAQSMLAPDKTYNRPWKVPVHVNTEREYIMTATIYGASKTFDTGKFSADDNNEASISATLSMCNDDDFNKGGAVDQIHPDELAVEKLSNKGVEKNLFAGARNFKLVGETTCECTADSRLKNTHVDPAIICKTHGSMLYKTMSYIQITEVHMHYTELPCGYFQANRPRKREVEPKTAPKPAEQPKTAGRPAEPD